MERPKTIFCDIDGTLWDHVGDITQQVNVETHKLLPNTVSALNRWDKLGYRIILTTGRRESMRELTEKHLKKLGIVYDTLIMGLGGGARVLVNDRKPSSTKNTAFVVNLIRNEGLKHFDFGSEYCVIPNLSKEKKISDRDESEIVEFNDNYIVSKIKLYPLKKNLVWSKGNNIPIEMNKLMTKTFCVISGELIIKIKNDFTKLKQGDSFTINPMTEYSRRSVDGCQYFETSSIEVWE